ncbi:hypothetical protein K491DRAFT_760415 [Lophiostoma macrostomum CBS 122681]|uniref:Uncharacterized protein n=1 Tax=Lophiostoma macrostomum CBS 122681 TaxID=1314788 RepID=A0A6A6T1C8_9PLEO|nr:hypothetical protein K491DRAFT_760415 [Lophiostoma macrostomum CBS 122681]
MDYSHLNSSQLRVQSIKEELKNHNVLHLETFIDGINDPEPPDYRKVNGKIQPSLAQVTLKDGAKKYDMGNVFFSEDSSTSRVMLAMERGEVEAYRLDPHPKDPNNPLSSSILDNIFVSLLPLWKAKYEAIIRRMDSINQVRVYAHNAPHQPEKKFSYGKSVTKLMHQDDSSPKLTNGQSRKRAIGDSISRHPVNKRKRISLASIPDTVKCQTFDTIPDSLKLALFDMVAHAAFPNFNDLLMAAWNTVSIYEHVGTEFPEFHRAITDLKTVLLELDATYRKEQYIKSDADAADAADEASGRNGVQATNTEVLEQTEVTEVRQRPLTENRHVETALDPAADALMTPLNSDSAGTSPPLGTHANANDDDIPRPSSDVSSEDMEARNAAIAHYFKARQAYERVAAQLPPEYDRRVDANSPKLPAEHVTGGGNGFGNRIKHRSNRSMDHLNMNAQSPRSPRSSMPKNSNIASHDGSDSPRLQPQPHSRSHTQSHPHSHPRTPSHDRTRPPPSSVPKQSQSDTPSHPPKSKDKHHAALGQTPSSIYLGNSKLGRPKGTAGGVCVAPEAPMMHNAPSQEVKKESGSSSGSGNGGD